MADTKASAFTLITALTDDDTIPVIDDQDGTPLNRQITAANLKAAVRANLAEASASSTLTLTTSVADIPGMTYTTLAAGTFLVIANFDFEFDDADSFCEGILNVNGVDVTTRIRLDLAGTNDLRVHQSKTWKVTTAGAEVIKARALKASGTGTSKVYTAESQLHVLGPFTSV